jgi:hypothetical protein
MTVNIHYDGHTYRETHDDFDAIVARVKTLLDSSGGGIMLVKEDDTPVAVFIAKGIPIAIQEEKASVVVF